MVMICFADDTVLLYNDKSIDIHYDKADIGLVLVNQWLDNNSLQQSCYLYFSINKLYTDMSKYKLGMCNNLISRQNNV